MPTELYANNASTTVAAAKTAVAAGVTETWVVASSAGWPAASSSVAPATQFSIGDPAANTELIRVINVSGSTWTVIRGVEGTTPVAHAAGFTIQQIITARSLVAFDPSKIEFAKRRLTAAVAGVATSPVRVLCIGDSNTEGQGATLQDNRYVSQLALQMRALFAVSGINGGAGYIPPRLGSGSPSYTLPAVITGAPANSGYGWGSRSVDLATTAQYVTWTVFGTSFDVLYARGPASGVISYSIDGATAVNITTSTGNLGRTDTQARTTVAFAARGIHTVRIQYVSGATVNLEGIIVYDQDEAAGVQVYDSGYFGMSTSNLTTFIGYGDFGFKDRIVMLQPHVVTIQLGTNDASTGAGNLTAAQYKTNMATIIDTITAACTVVPTIVLIATFKPDITFVEPWGNYMQALYDLAAQYPQCCVIDYNSRMGQVNGDVQGLYADTVHWNNKGHSVAATILANFLTAIERPAATLKRQVSRTTVAMNSSVVTYGPTGLSIPLAANTSYSFEAFGQYRSAATTTGIGLRMNFSGTLIATRYEVDIWGAVTSGSTPTKVVSSANQGANLTPSVVAATTDYAWGIRGVIRVGATGGQLAVEFASEVAASQVSIMGESIIYGDPA